MSRRTILLGVRAAAGRYGMSGYAYVRIVKGVICLSLRRSPGLCFGGLTPFQSRRIADSRAILASIEEPEYLDSAGKANPYPVPFRSVEFAAEVARTHGYEPVYMGGGHS